MPDPAARSEPLPLRALNAQGEGARAEREAARRLDALIVFDADRLGAEGHWIVRHAGPAVRAALGEDVVGSDPCAIWRGGDRAVVRAVLDSVMRSRAPATLHARAETLHGEAAGVRLTLEALGPLAVIGRYELEDADGNAEAAAPDIGSRALWRHRLRGADLSATLPNAAGPALPTRGA